MREIGPSGSSVGHRDCDCECGVGAEATGERAQGEAGEEELSVGLPTTEQPLLPVLHTQAIAATAGGRRGGGWTLKPPVLVFKNHWGVFPWFVSLAVSTLTTEVWRCERTNSGLLTNYNPLALLGHLKGKIRHFGVAHAGRTHNQPIGTCTWYSFVLFSPKG